MPVNWLLHKLEELYLKFCHGAMKQSKWKFIYVVFILLNTLLTDLTEVFLKQQSLRKGVTILTYIEERKPDQ